jgi:hypothetical protein
VLADDDGEDYKKVDDRNHRGDQVLFLFGRSFARLRE